MKHRLTVLIVMCICLINLVSCGSTQADRYHEFDDNRKNVGIYMENAEEIRALDEQPDIYGWFEYWYGHVSETKLKYLEENPDLTPMITWMPDEIPLREVADGRHDAYIKRFLKIIARACPNRDILIRFAHEMELRPENQGGWYTWQQDGAEAYKSAWIHIVTLAREMYPQFKWVWAPNHADEYAKPFYPGDDYVDYVGVTLNHYSSKKTTYQYFEDYYAQEGIRDFLEAYGKKIIIAETSYSGDNEEIKARFLRSIFEYYRKDDKICAIVYFNFNITDSRMYKITDNEKYMQIVTEGIRSLHNEKTK